MSGENDLGDDEAEVWMEPKLRRFAVNRVANCDMLIVAVKDEL